MKILSDLILREFPNNLVMEILIDVIYSFKESGILTSEETIIIFFGCVFKLCGLNFLIFLLLKNLLKNYHNPLRTNNAAGFRG